MMQPFLRLQDPRLAVATLQLAYIIVGITVLGFNRSPAQITLLVLATCTLDVILHRLLKQAWLFPFSALITGLSLSILVNYAHGLWLPLVPVFFAISSKYLLTVSGRPAFNPSLFGIVCSLFLADNMISVAPAYQWDGIAAMTLIIVTAAILLFVLRIKRSALVLSFLFFYSLALLLRAVLMRHHIPPETLILGSLSTPSFYLFTFFMITDPVSSPQSRKGQILMAFSIVLIDLYLHSKETLSTLFYAAFIVYGLRFSWLHYQQRKSLIINIKQLSINLAVITITGLSGLFSYQAFHPAKLDGTQNPGFYLTQIAATDAGISTHQGDIFAKVDPRLQHVAKWLLSVGDAVAIADFDNDGLQDVFLSYPLKASADRAALYKNIGNFQFVRVPLPVLDKVVQSPERYGLITAGLWFDMDNDGDQDLLLSVGYGYPILLQNQLQQTGKVSFIDVSQENQLTDYAISLTANAFDYDRDGWLDIIIGNAMNPWLPDYPQATPFNLFNLPLPAFQGDRRMLNVMHRSWHNAINGGENILLRNQQGLLSKQDIASLGLSNTGWTLDIGTGDLNNDGWTDLYLANDFGPDALYINQHGKNFKNLKGKLRGTLGQDTYKGMNSSLADLDGNGALDIYVSNVHEPLQAEGSMLWLNNGLADSVGISAFTDAAQKLNALNPHRFGWGAAIGDMDRDGKPDILQANGMVDNAYDKSHKNCPDYWYWNAKIALTTPDIHGYADQWADLRGRCIFPYEQNRVMLKRGRYFIDVASHVGWTAKDNARGIALADMDNDGDLDVLMTHQFAPVSIFRNDAEQKSWIGFQLQGNGIDCNRDATGTQVVISYMQQQQKLMQLSEVVASNGLSSQSDHRLLFGLNHYQGTVKVDINWCGKKHQQLSLMPMQYHLIRDNL